MPTIPVLQETMKCFDSYEYKLKRNKMTEELFVSGF